MFLQILTVSGPTVSATNPKNSPTILTAISCCKVLTAEWSGVYGLKHRDNSENENDWSNFDWAHSVFDRVLNGEWICSWCILDLRNSCCVLNNEYITTSLAFKSFRLYGMNLVCARKPNQYGEGANVSFLLHSVTKSVLMGSNHGGFLSTPRMPGSVLSVLVYEFVSVSAEPLDSS